ncbi:MAG: MBL fold metallo-hydrolase [Firmicutes bacterium]|nr:MBL fold metallo-hydrolase [Bacillota bacterium]
MRVKRFSVSPMGTNCYIYQDEKTGRCAVVDPGEMTDELRAAVELVGKDAFDYILLTHCHFDHVAGASAFRDLTGAPISIYEDDADGLGNSDINVSALFGRRFKYAEADKKFFDGEKFKVGETEFTVMHTPGHSRGSCCYITEGLIFSGDTLFRECIGRTDMPGGDYRSMYQSLQRLAALPGDYLVYPGHEMHTTLSNEREHNPYFKMEDY